MSAPNNEVNLTITDGALGNVTAPPAKTQAVIGCCSAGTVGQVMSTSSKTALISAFGYGPAIEAACLKIDAGANVLFVKTTANAAGSSGAVTATAGNTSTSVVTVSVATAFDDYRVKVLVDVAGTVGASASIRISLDAGRTYGPSIALGAAVTYAIKQSGLTLAFAAGTLVKDDTFTFTTVAPAWNTAGVQVAILALQASAFTWGGGIHIVGAGATTAAGATSGAKGTDATAIQGYLDTLAGQFRYSFAFLDTADAVGGLSTGETTWVTALQTDYAAVSATRICAGAGFANIQSPIPNPDCGAPIYRRPGTWSAARRAIQVPIQVHLGRVRDGALGVTSFPAAVDTYLYHDERVTPGLDGSRFMALRTIINRPGQYVKNPNLMSAPGSDFSMLMYRQVMDVACAVAHDVLELYVNDSVRLDPSTGFIVEQDARQIESDGKVALAANLTSKGAVSAASIVVARNDNLSTTKTLNVTVRVLALGYVLEIDVSIGFQNVAFVGN